MARYTWPVPVKYDIGFPWGAYYKNKFGVRVPTPGNRHYGVDFPVPEGTPIYAIGTGTVTRAGWHKATRTGFGLMVQYRLADGTGYVVHAHNNRIDVKIGDAVSQGQQIGLSGSTGFSTGPHSHVELQTRQDDQRSSKDWAREATRTVPTPRPVVNVRNLAYGTRNADVATLAALIWNLHGPDYQRTNKAAWDKEPANYYGPMLQRAVRDAYTWLYRTNPKAWPNPATYKHPGLAGPQLIRHAGGIPV